MTIRFIAIVEGVDNRGTDPGTTGPAKLTLNMPNSRGGKKIEVWVERTELSRGYFPGDVVDVAITPK